MVTGIHVITAAMLDVHDKLPNGHITSSRKDVHLVSTLERLLSEYGTRVEN